MNIRTYLRDEIVEEGTQGLRLPQEVRRRLARVDDPAGARNVVSRGTAISRPATADSGLVCEDDSRIVVRHGQTMTGLRTISYYAVYPVEHGNPAGILVLHENRGLAPHIRNVARRLAVAGYVAFAPDLLAPLGGTPSFPDPGELIAALGTREPADMETDLMTALTQLAADPVVDAQRLGVIGFCFGGGMAWRLLTRDNRLKAGVPFYGRNPPLSDVPQISAPVLGIYGGLDTRISAGLRDIEKAMSEGGKVFGSACSTVPSTPSITTLTPTGTTPRQPRRPGRQRPPGSTGTWARKRPDRLPR